MKLSTFLAKISNQEKPLGISTIMFTVIGVIFVRTFLESFSSLDVSKPFTSGYPVTHFIYFYFSIILSLALLLHFLTKVSVPKIVGLITKLLPIIWLPPVIDSIITAGKGWEMSYNILKPDEIIPAFFTFFGHLQGSGISPGIRIEILIVLAGVALFTYYHTKNIYLSSFGIAAGYVIFFVYAALPSLVATPWIIENSETNSFLFFNDQFSNSWLATTHSLVSIPTDLIARFQQQTDIFMARIFWLAIIFQSLLLFRIFNFSLWSAWRKNLRLERVFYYCTIGVLGMLLCPEFLDFEKIINLPNFLALAIFFILISLNAWFAVTVNDEVDTEIDKISNPDRPLVKNTISIKEMRAIGFVLFVFIISGAVLLNYVTFYLLLMFQAVYFIYSAYPLRLKRFIFSASPLLGFNALAIAMAGFFLVSPDQHIAAFPKFMLWLIFIGFTIVTNVKDLKDYEGDKLEKIQTIPTIFGLKNGKMIIGTACATVILLLGFLSDSSYFFSVSLLFALFSFYLVNMKNYRELYLFYLFFAYAVLVSICIAKNILLI